MAENSGFVGKTEQPIEYSERTDPLEKLIEVVEEHTLEVLNGRLLPVPLACLRCTQKDRDQSFVKAMIDGTVRACRKHLANYAQDVRNYPATSILRQLGLDDSDNPLHEAVASALEPILEEMRNANVGDVEVLVALVSSPLPSKRRRQPPSATNPEVFQHYDRIVNVIRRNVGEEPTRDQIATAMSDYLGKNVSTGLVSKVRKQKGVDKKRAPKPTKIGFDLAESTAAQRQHKASVAEGNSFTAEADMRIDEEDAQIKLRTMTLAEQEKLARKLYVQLPLPEDQDKRIKLLSKAQTFLGALEDLSEAELIKYANENGIPTERQTKQALIKALMSFLRKNP